MKGKRQPPKRDGKETFISRDFEAVPMMTQNIQQFSESVPH